MAIFIYYSEDQKKFIVKSSDKKPEDAVPAAKGYEAFFCSLSKYEAFAQIAADEKNRKIEEGERIKVCRDCRKYFAISKKTCDFYKSKGLKVPSRCNSCREARKEKLQSRSEAKKAKNNMEENKE